MGYGRIMIMIIGTFAAGVYLLPSTLSLFAGQHLWYDVNPGGNDIPCTKCHADILDELSLGKYHIKQKGDPNAADWHDCSFCHRVNSSITYARGDGAGTWVGKEAHAASLIQCMYCHAFSRYGAPYAGGFGLTNYTYDSGIYAAHREFVVESNLSSIMLDENEACISCHTQIGLAFNYTTVRVMGVEITETYSPDGTGTSQNWDFTSAGNITYLIESSDRTVAGTVKSVWTGGG